MDPVTVSLLSILLSLFLYIVYRAWQVNQYWKDRGVPHTKPMLFFGNTLPLLLGTCPPGELYERMCKQFPNESYFGFFHSTNPELIIQDIELIKKILIKDFLHFVDRCAIVNEERDPLDSNLAVLCGTRWKTVRNRLSPIFSSGKLKEMFEIMIGCGEEMIKQLEAGSKVDVDFKEIFGCFALDAMGSCVFGLDVGNLANPDNEFRRIAKPKLEANFQNRIKLMLRHNPVVARFLNLSLNRPYLLKYFSNIVKDALKYRRENGYTRNDFIQLIIELQNKGYVEVSSDDATCSSQKFELTLDQITGHAIFFLPGGFDAPSSGMLFTLYELSRNPKIQEKVREEILKEVNLAGALTYGALGQMHYLEQCIKEALRMYSIVQKFSRKCTKQYTFPNGLTIEPGKVVLIPVAAIHNNPKYYPEPREYRPERFARNQKIPACAFLPFGAGPRMCLEISDAELTDDQLTGHAVSFLTVGFDATSSAMLFTVYELSRNPSIQGKVRQEIRREIERAGSLTYDSLKDMTYLEQCVKEALRMYPPAQLLARVCTKQYTFNNGMTIDPGQPILIPTLFVHNDPKYYPDPRVFRPERFDPNNTIPVGAYLPFGNGPRICLAMRFAMLEIKFCIANLLRNYTVSISPKTKQPITLKPNSMITTPNEVLYFNIRENNILD
uniref:Cytochrome n=2 Tax=Rhodnius prolixus TaxID=13249 RepID=A0ABL0EJV1_RHOPR